MNKTKKKPNRRYQGLLTFLGFITAGLVVAQVLVFIFFSTQAGALAEINQEKERLVLENHQLQTEINQLTFLPVLEDRAEKLGFLPPASQDPWSSVIYLSKQLPIASAN